MAHKRSVGKLARLGIRIANLMRPMDVLYSGRGLASLPGLTNVTSDMPALRQDLADSTAMLQVRQNKGNRAGITAEWAGNKLCIIVLPFAPEI
jgi:hypothetical protein